MRIRAALALVSLGSGLAAAAETAPAAKAAVESDPVRLSRGLQELSARVRPAVVQIMTTGYATSEGATSLISKQRGTGCGVILDPAGYIVTNAHVVQGAHRIQIILAGPPAAPPEPKSIVKAHGKTLGAQVVGIDRETDLAVLKIQEEGLSALPLGDSEALQQGELVMAFGSPLGLEGSVSLGVVSAMARQVKPDDRMIYVQTDASINPGNSGGPLVDAQGRVVGINTFILSQSGGSEGIGFAAPSNIVRNVFEQLRRSGKVRRGQIGARAQTITPLLAAGLGLPQGWGVVLSDVKPDGPAARAGLAIGDLVLTLDGKVMENARQFEVNLYRRPVGETLSLEVLRGGRKWLVRVEMAERVDDPDLAEMVSPERNVVERLGILGLDLDEKVQAMLPSLRAKAGVVVAARAADAPAWQDPLQAGDVVYAVNQEPIGSLEKLRRLLGDLGPGAPVVLQIERSGELRYIAFELE